MTMTNQDFSMYAGDTKNLIISVTKDDGSQLDLTGCQVKWGLRERRNSSTNIITKTTSDSIMVTGNEITIKLINTDSSNLHGTYYHECELTDTLGNVSTIFTGIVTIEPSGI